MLTLADLAEQSDVSQRTIRYYIQFGLLPAPGSAGPKARYGRRHLGRLLLIRMLQDRHLPLSAIRKVLAQRTETELERIGETSGPQSRSSAVDYVMSLLESTPKQGALFVRSVQRLEAEGAEPPGIGHDPAERWSNPRRPTLR
jgi:DNA-binding transcriptional MerR regulator